MELEEAAEAPDEAIALATAAVYEADGTSQSANNADDEARGPVREVTIHVSDATAAGQGIADTAAEYEGEAVLRPLEGVGVQAEVTLPGEYAEDFLLAVIQWDTDPDSVQLPSVDTEGTVTLLLTLAS